MGDGKLRGVKKREKEAMKAVIWCKIRHVGLWVLVLYYYLKGLLQVQGRTMILKPKATIFLHCVCNTHNASM
jgi:hypothetical protein